jgi:2'-5' RNA ligase
MPQESDQIRCFIAIELPDRIKDGLRQLESSLRTNDPSRGRWVDPGGIHLTLKFLGNVEINKVASITGKMNEAAQATHPFRLGIHGLGAFPNLRKVQVVWVGIKGDLERLQTLQKALEAGMAEIGFPAENRPFTPHLTLARLRETATIEQRQALGEYISELRIETDLMFEVNSFSLMRSQLTRDGAVYSQLASIDL